MILFIACFDWKISVFQQTVLRIHYIFDTTPAAIYLFKVNNWQLQSRSKYLAQSKEKEQNWTRLQKFDI